MTWKTVYFAQDLILYLSTSFQSLLGSGAAYDILNREHSNILNIGKQNVSIFR